MFIHLFKPMSLAYVFSHLAAVFLTVNATEDDFITSVNPFIGGRKFSLEIAGPCSRSIFPVF